MKYGRTKAFGDDWFATLLHDGRPPCDPPDACEVCVLFTVQRPDESRSDWLARITGYIRIELESAS